MCKEKQMVYLVGIGMGNQESMTGRAKQVFAECDCIIGAERMLEGMELKDKEVYVSYKPQEIHAFLKAHPQCRNIAVALSGDPGFYSGAKKLEQELSEYKVCFVPGISSAVYLAAALGICWEDAVMVSIHGRKQNFIHTIRKHEKTFLLFGGLDSGKTICEKIRQYGLGDTEFCIGKNLSYPNEEILRKKGAELTVEDFEGLAAAYVLNPHPDQSLCPHIEDEEFIRGKVPMTKSEIRTVSITSLKLTKDAVLYDVGAGTGSISIEAARQSGEMRVYAVERNPEAVGLIRQNRWKFGCDQVEIVEGTAPGALADLEAPTHVFIGGSSGNLKAILRLVQEKNPNVRIVLNAISLETVKEAMEAIEEGLLPHAEIVQLSVAKARKLGEYHMMTGQNPVYIISSER